MMYQIPILVLLINLLNYNYQDLYIIIYIIPGASFPKPPLRSLLFPVPIFADAGLYLLYVSLGLYAPGPG